MGVGAVVAGVVSALMPEDLVHGDHVAVVDRRARQQHGRVGKVLPDLEIRGGGEPNPLVHPLVKKAPAFVVFP